MGMAWDKSGSNTTDVSVVFSYPQGVIVFKGTVTITEVNSPYVELDPLVVEAMQQLGLSFSGFNKTTRELAALFKKLNKQVKKQQKVTADLLEKIFKVFECDEGRRPSFPIPKTTPAVERGTQENECRRTRVSVPHLARPPPALFPFFVVLPSKEKMMSSRTLVQLVCDECSYVETFVLLERNQQGAVGSVTIQESVERRGWTRQKLIGSNLLVLDYCTVCSELRQVKHQPESS